MPPLQRPIKRKECDISLFPFQQARKRCKKLFPVCLSANRERKKTMFEELKNKAKACKTYEEVDALLKSIEEDYTISDRKYYYLKHIAIDAVYNNNK